jgi:hypothetical protein
MINWDGFLGRWRRKRYRRPTNLLEPRDIRSLAHNSSVALKTRLKLTFILFEDFRIPNVANTRKLAIPPRPSSVRAFTNADIFLHSMRMTKHINFHSVRRTPLVSNTRHATPVQSSSTRPPSIDPMSSMAIFCR